MASTADRKLYLGPRFRMLRRELGLTQTRMAEELAVSPSYLNHLERNQRPLTTQMLLRLAQTYDIDIRDFVTGAQDATRDDLQAVFADPVVRDVAPPRHELLELVENHPGVADAVVRLHRALDDLRQTPHRLESAEAEGARVASPLSWLRATLEARHNHFAEIDEAAEQLAHALPEGPEALSAAMVERLSAQHGVTVRLEAADASPGRLRFYDYHRRRLSLSERLGSSGRQFALAYQLAFQELGEVIGAATTRERPPSPEAGVLVRIALTNYAAAALVMPYARFHDAAERSRYDLTLLAARFGASVEQVAHRLTTLGRTGSRGVPFFMLKLDVAGNVSKRLTADGSLFARGGCPRWRVYDALSRPGETTVDLIEAPDGRSFFTFARAVTDARSERAAVVVLGCDARHMDRLAYAARPVGASPNPIGPGCHLCERPNCRERALPPVARALLLHQYERPDAPYPFRATV